MDSLDSLVTDLHMTERKRNRVRSWYLYEQYKSLEHSQLEAAQKLKDRSYQDRILRRELNERRARRKLYDQDVVYRTESHRKNNIKSEGTKTTLSVSCDDFFESFCELQDAQSDVTEPETENTLDQDGNYSQDDSLASRHCTEDFPSISEGKDEHSYEESIKSVVRNYKYTENLADEIKEELKLIKNNIAENINIQLETAEESLQCLQKYSKICEDDKVLEYDNCNSNDYVEVSKVILKENGPEYDNNVIAMWTKLVSFAYQIIKFNHGNCYSDYSSQVLTAVLACDVLRRGINRMCHILQPYVSPVKYATDDSDDSITEYKNVKKKSGDFEKAINMHDYKIPCTTKVRKRRYFDKKYNSERCSKSSTGKNIDFKQRRTSEPVRSVANLFTDKQKSNITESTIWPKFSRDSSIKQCNCSCHALVENPMLKITRYLDRLLADIEDYI